QCLDELEKLFTEVCQQHLMSDVPFGVFLSGGLDSSAVVATMRRLLKTDPLTFTVGYSGSDGINEFDYSRLVSEHVGTAHHEVMLSPQEFQTGFQNSFGIWMNQWAILLACRSFS